MVYVVYHPHPVHIVICCPPLLFVLSYMVLPVHVVVHQSPSVCIGIHSHRLAVLCDVTLVVVWQQGGVVVEPISLVGPLLLVVPQLSECISNHLIFKFLVAEIYP